MDAEPGPGNVESEVDYSDIIENAPSADDVLSTAVPIQNPSQCILHTGEQSEKFGSLRPIDQKAWTKILLAADARKIKKFYDKSKLHGVVESLPIDTDESMGYHVKCYSDFTAVVKEKVRSNSADANTNQRPPRTRSLSPLMSTSRVGIFPHSCIYCGKETKKTKQQKEGLQSVVTKDSAEKILRAAVVTRNAQLLSRISGVDLISKEAKLHNSCRVASLRAAERLRDVNAPSTSQSSKPKNRQSINQLYEYVRTEVINNSRPELVKSILDRYETLCENLEEESSICDTSYLAKLLRQKFPTEIKIVSGAKKSGMIAHSINMNFESIQTLYDFQSSPEGHVMKTALMLRKCLKNCEKTPISEPIDLKSLFRGEALVPDLAKLLFTVLYSGSGETSDSVKRKVESACQDALYNVCNGTVKTKKHMLLAMTIKSLTGSRELVTILNRLGHAVSYTKVEELETALATTILDRGMACPPGVNRNSVVGLAFDNYDELCHTLSGSNTLHDTMGILYCGARPQQGSQDFQLGKNPGLGGPKQGSRKRTLVNVERELEPYRKKPCVQSFRYSNLETPNVPLECHMQPQDLLYLILHAHVDSGVPMWLGFNSMTHVDNLEKQTVHYMPNLNKAITSNEVVRETMRVALGCAHECGQKYGLVTYDLDVAKTAMRIRSTDLHEFKDLFIMLGSFHIFICFFRAVGKLIQESGLPDMLVDSGVLAPGSLRSFLKCKNYNRCRRLHPMLALALEILHFRRFVEEYENRELLELAGIWKYNTREALDISLSSAAFVEVRQAYNDYVKRTESGELGQTAKFCFMYINYIKIYHNLERSIRENNLDEFIANLSPTIALFFSTNRTFYSRWLTKYQLDLLNAEETHPGIRQLLESGGFSIRRSDNGFARLPVDLTLEQTVNRDAASRLTGYTDCTNNYGARLRWSATKSARAAIVGEMKEMAGIGARHESQAELSPSRLIRDNSDLEKIVSHIEHTLNPFGTVEIPALVNIATGKHASSEITESLLGVPKVGAQLHRKFVAECSEDDTRFERTVKRNKLLTFAKNCVSNKKSDIPKVAELKCTSQLMGRIAFAATKQAIDLHYVFSFPLTPVPLSLFRGDGSMHHTDKSKIFHALEAKVEEHGEPKDPGCTIIDGCFILRAMNPSQPGTYGALSRNILAAVLQSKSSRIDVTFDTYETPSIKDSERDRRGGVSRNLSIVISGPQQRRDGSFAKQLDSEGFKRALPSFLVDEWHRPEYAPLIGNRELYVGVQGTCYRFYVRDDMVERETVPALDCNHPESDTRSALHAQHAVQHSLQAGQDCIIRFSDTDILIIMLYHVNKFKDVTFWGDCGTSNHRRFVNITKIAQALGPAMCAALPGLHSFTGCDFTSAFARKGKIRPLDMTIKCPPFQLAFSDLSNEQPSPVTYDTLKEFVTVMYGAKKPRSLNSQRYMTVEKSYASKGGPESPFQGLRTIEGSSIPPSEAEVGPHIDRANFVAHMWASALNADLPKHPAKGWVLDDGGYTPVYFTGPQLPASLVPHVPENDEDEEDQEEDRIDVGDLEWEDLEDED